MRTTLIILLTTITVMLQTGCGTIQCLSSPRSHAPWHMQTNVPHNAVYGGVRRCLVSDPTADTLGPMVLDVAARYVDLPFSFVLDTIILPYTIFSEKKPMEPVPYAHHTRTMSDSHDSKQGKE